MRPPRDPKTQPLLDWKLLFNGFVVVGVFESVFAFLFFFAYLRDNGIELDMVINSFEKFGQAGAGYPEDTTELLLTARSIYFVTLVVCQWGQLLTVRGRNVP
eukprot:RCo028536